MGNNLSKLPRCYHGFCLTKEEFNCDEYFKVLDDYERRHSVDEDIKETKFEEFYKIYHRLMVDETFARFIVAHVTTDFLKGKDDATLGLRLILLLDIRYIYIPQHEGKDVRPDSEITRNYQKYGRDILTERGRINCMAREISCDCMEEKLIEAKKMEKIAVCFCCEEEFPKEKMRRCKGCDHVQYCSKECYKKDWPDHKEWCKRNSVLSASTPTSVPSSFGEPSDVDAED